MPTEMLTKREQRARAPVPPAAVQAGWDEASTVSGSHARRVRRLEHSLAVWVLGTILVTTLWVIREWRANGALESFGHEGEPGQWNPTLPALVVGLWGLVVGIMALGVRFHERRLAFHTAAWLLGMAVLTPLWALIEWQDNGAFERWSTNGRPGDWDPWILTVGGIWALVVVALALRAQLRGRRA